MVNNIIGPKSLAYAFELSSVIICYIIVSLKELPKDGFSYNVIRAKGLAE